MLVNICMKFHEDTLNGFNVTERTQFCLRTCYLQSKFHSASCHMVLNICTHVKKFHEDILKGFKVKERT